MPFAFIIVGTVLTISGVRGTSAQLLTLLKGDILGKGGYLYWLVAILAIGSLGYIDSLKGFSRAFLILVLIVLLLKKGSGFFDDLQEQLSEITNNTLQGSSNNAQDNTSSLVDLVSQAG